MRPQDEEDLEQFAHRVTRIAWSNGKYAEREACLKMLDDNWYKTQSAIATAIRARGDK